MELKRNNYDNIGHFYPKLKHENLISLNYKTRTNAESESPNSNRTSRRFFLREMTLLSLTTSYSQLVWAFDGGVGGLGKTKPNMGVYLWDESFPPTVSSVGSDTTVISELNIDGRPNRVSFNSGGYPLLPIPAGATSVSIETRDLQKPESAFLQIVQELSTVPSPTSKTKMVEFLSATVLSQQGKFGAYGTPVDIKVKNLLLEKDSDATSTAGTTNGAVSCAVTFTTYTPNLIETDRQILIKAIPIAYDNKSPTTWVMLIVGTTRIRFGSVADRLETIRDSVTVNPISSQVRDRPVQPFVRRL